MGFGIIASPDGKHVYVTGYSQGTLDGNTSNGGYDIFIAKYEATNGTKLWVKLLGSGANDSGTDIAISPNGDYIYITGYTYGSLDSNSNSGYYDVFIAKYEATNGTKQWVKQLGSGTGESASGITISPTGDYVYITGYTYGDLDSNSNNGDADIFIAKYRTSDGNKEWVELLGTGTEDKGRAITISPTGDYIYITGNTQGDLDGNSNNGSYDIFITKYDTNGNKIWVKLLGTDQPDTGYNITISPSADNVYVTGNTYGALDGNSNNGGYDIFIRKDITSP